ncbi:MAG TPA: roadblock/LC7 domain-containing protein [Dactylosporangium sp.]|jgi:predicted regulator of Ras-like GTPase activity (Roadblock/LC7/MglB family)|nr:roadblock/LC7 domain-containing protein [Dactylosporangium sp.]
MTQPALAPANELHRMLDDLVERVPAAELAVLTSADGLSLVASGAVSAETGEVVAATASGLHALAVAAGEQLCGGTTLRMIVEMEHVLLAIEPAGRDALLAVAFTGAPDPAEVNGPVTETAERAARALGPGRQRAGSGDER